MKLHGKTIDKTRKYSFDEIRKVCHQYMQPALEKVSKEVFECCLMAFKDFLLDRGDYTPEDMIKYTQLVEKYSLDYKANDFSLADIKKYNREIP